MTVGQRVRIVDMRGCMANDRTNPREGVVTGFIGRTPYGATQPYVFVQILMDDGTQEERVDTPGLWTLYRRLQEYRE